MDTEVLLLMAELLIELTPDDPTDERKLSTGARRLLEQPKDYAERARLAQASYLRPPRMIPWTCGGGGHELLGRLGRSSSSSGGPTCGPMRCALGPRLGPGDGGASRRGGRGGGAGGLMGLAGRNRSRPSPGRSASRRLRRCLARFPWPGRRCRSDGWRGGDSDIRSPSPPMAAGPMIQSAVQLAGRWQLQSPFGVCRLLELRPDGFQSQVSGWGS